MTRQSESEKAALILRKMLEQDLPVYGVKPVDRKKALQLAISLLEARAIDAQYTEKRGMGYEDH